MTKSILITGGSGLIGTRLTELLLTKGHRVFHVGRHKGNGRVPQFVWDTRLGIIDPRAIAGADVIIHLAGAGVAEHRWTKSRKEEILGSRLNSTDLLFHALKKGDHQIKAFISASAIGYYGLSSDDSVKNETSPAGNDFLAQVTQQWEQASSRISSLGIRTTVLRIGIVLSANGGALPSMAKPIKLGVGAALGSGKQWMSWIHLDDLCGIFIKAAEDDTLHGIYNAVGVEPVTNLGMTKTIARVLRRPLWLPPIPGIVLTFALGEMAEMVLNGSKVSAEKIQEAGFRFQFTELTAALQDLYKTGSSPV
jgi:uncharacterized protein (TIGR01777 family)